MDSTFAKIPLYLATVPRVSFNGIAKNSLLTRSFLPFNEISVSGSVNGILETQQLKVIPSIEASKNRGNFFIGTKIGWLFSLTHVK